jgi:hypothetical protein
MAARTTFWSIVPDTSPRASDTKPMERATAMTLTLSSSFLVEHLLPDTHMYNVSTPALLRDTLHAVRPRSRCRDVGFAVSTHCGPTAGEGTLIRRSQRTGNTAMSASMPATLTLPWCSVLCWIRQRHASAVVATAFADAGE